MRRIRDVAERVRKSHLHGFELTVDRLQAVTAGQFEFFQDIQSHKRDDTLPVRRDLADVVAAVVDRDGFDPVGFVRGQIFITQQAAEPAAFRVDLLRQFAAVVAFRVRRADLLERVRVIRQNDQIASLGHFAARGKGIEQCLIDRIVAMFSVSADAALPHVRQIGATGIAVTGIVHRGGQVFRKAQFSKASDHFRPGFRRTGYGHRQPAVAWHFAICRLSACQNSLDRCQSRRAAAGVQTV